LLKNIKRKNVFKIYLQNGEGTAMYCLAHR